MVEIYKEKIINDKLTPELNRGRSGRTQYFYVKNWNEPILKLVHEKQEMFAQLIDGEWCWVNGCSKCEDSFNPGERYPYSVCVEHDVCVECGIHRNNLKDTPWGHENGFICKPCMNKVDAKIRKEALDKVNSKDYDEYDYMYIDEIICPHCGTMQDGLEDVGEGESIQTCETCNGKFNLDVETKLEFSTSVVGERITE